MRLVTLLLMLTLATTAWPQTEPRVPAPIVYFDIAGPETAALRAFYQRVFAWDIAVDGSFSATVASPVPAQIRPDPAEKRIYIGVEDVAATLAQITANGGTVDAPRFEVPGVVILGLFRDPAGNPMGLVEQENGRVKIP